MEANTYGTEEQGKKEDSYQFQEFPKNVRQIGIPMPGKKIYLEDYVITYLKQAFTRMQSSRIVILLGKRGKETAAGGIFVYGAIALPEEETLENTEFSDALWNELYQQIRESFSGAQILGWACGVDIWNSEVDRRIRKIHKEQFGNEDSILLIQDVSELEEKLFLWEYGVMKELPGYYIFYEKNYQMQDFMLSDQKAESTDADYEDVVTSNVRHVITEKEEEKRKRMQLAGYVLGTAAVLAILMGINVLLESTARINNMEKTVDALSQYVNQGYARQSSEEEPQETADTRQTKTAKKKSEQQNENGQDSSEQETDDTKQAETKSKADSEAAEQENESEQTVAAGNGSTGMQQYIVQKGDTLSQILWAQYHTLQYRKEIKKLNGIQDEDKIYEGQCLLLPDYSDK